jgi:hypothetical protein
MVVEMVGMVELLVLAAHLVVVALVDTLVMVVEALGLVVALLLRVLVGAVVEAEKLVEHPDGQALAAAV